MALPRGSLVIHQHILIQKAQAFDIWYAASSIGLLLRMFKYVAVFKRVTINLRRTNSLGELQDHWSSGLKFILTAT